MQPAVLSVQYCEYVLLLCFRFYVMKNLRKDVKHHAMGTLIYYILHNLLAIYVEF